MDPWYKVATPRREVREGRSFNPDEFAIALEQVVAGNAPEDYRDPEKFFSRTCFTRALKEHAGMVCNASRENRKTQLRYSRSSRNLVAAKRILLRLSITSRRTETKQAAILVL